MVKCGNRNFTRLDLQAMRAFRCGLGANEDERIRQACIQKQMKEITLAGGQKCAVDDSDYERLSAFGWYRTSHGYAARGGGFYMHHEIMGKQPPGIEIDHRDGNGLNNQRDNLRICTKGQNRMNCAIMRNNTTGVKGVYWEKQQSKYRARITIKRKTVHLGLFDSLRDAQLARIAASERIFGEFSNDRRLAIAANQL